MFSGGVSDNLQLIEVEVHVLVSVEDVRRLVEQVVEELGQQKGSPLVLLFGDLHLLLDLQVVLLERLIFHLGSRKLLLDFFELVLQEVDQIVILLGCCELLRC